MVKCPPWEPRRHGYILIVPTRTTLLFSFKSAYHRTATANMVQEGSLESLSKVCGRCSDDGCVGADYRYLLVRSFVYALGVYFRLCGGLRSDGAVHDVRFKDDEIFSIKKNATSYELRVSVIREWAVPWTQPRRTHSGTNGRSR